MDSVSVRPENIVGNQSNAVITTLEEYLELELREPSILRSSPTSPKNQSTETIWCQLCQHGADDIEQIKAHYCNDHTKEELVEKLIAALHPITTCGKTQITSLKQPCKKSPVKKSSSSVHICPVCEKHISGKGNLDKHLIRHRTLKPFSCDKCDRTFSAKRDLNLHVTRHHSNERPHVCPICSKGFVDKGYLKRHMEFHNENRIFVCEQCGKSFNTESGLNKHTKTHNPERPFMCEICSKCFRAKYDLTAHKRNMHK